MREGSDRKVYVGNLGNNASRTELEDEFSYYGPLVSVWIARNPPGFAYVLFEDSKDAKDAVRGLDGKTICDRRVKVDISNSRGSRSFDSRPFRPPPRYDSRPGGRFQTDMRCYNCSGMGHFARDCPRARSFRRRRSYSRSYSRSRSRSYSSSRSRSPRKRRRSASRSRSGSESPKRRRRTDRKGRRRSERSRSRSHSKSKSHSRSRSKSGEKSSKRSKSRSGSRSRKRRKRSRSRSRSPRRRAKNRSRSPKKRSKSRSRSPRKRSKSRSRSPRKRSKSRSRSPRKRSKSRSRSPRKCSKSRSRSPKKRCKSKSRSPSKSRPRTNSESIERKKDESPSKALIEETHQDKDEPQCRESSDAEMNCNSKEKPDEGDDRRSSFSEASNDERE